MNVQELRNEILSIKKDYGWSSALQTFNFGDELLEEFCQEFENSDWQKVGCYQAFSEEFFIQHKEQLNLTDILFNARNNWADMNANGDWVNQSEDMKTLIALDQRLQYLYNFAKNNVVVIQSYREINANEKEETV
jgi:hypothetical protein